MLIFPSFFNAAAGGYEIEQSLLSSADNQNLKRTPATSGNKQTWTWSGWIKRGELGAEQHFFESWEGVGDVMTYARFHSNDTIRVKQFQSGDIFELQTNAVFRDPSAWYHVVLSFDTTQATSSDRAKIYVNGELQSLGTANYPSQNLETFVNQSGYIHHLFADLYTSSRSFNGYMAEVHLIDGTALAPTDFGETNADGVWIPKAFTGSHGTEGWYMKFDPTATNGIGHDHSGNGNNLTISNFTTSGTGTDVFSDTPTNNFCTWNPLVLPSGYSSTQDGNLVGRFTNSANGSNMPSTFAVSSGKWYWETTLTATGSGASTGVALDTFNYSAAAGTNYLGGFSSGWAYEGSSGNKRNSPTNTSYGSTYTTSDIIGIALDMGTGKIWWSKNGTWQASGDPAAGTNEAFSNITGTVVPAISGSGSGGTTTWTLNAGQRDFAYTPPTGFKALNTSNLPAPTIKDGSEYFNTVIYTGASPSDKAVTGVGFQPDFTWIKARTQAYSHALYDAVRGATKELHSDTTDQEDTDTNGLKSFDSDGFTVGSDGEVGDPTGTRVAWNWLASNTSGSSNTDGSITSTVSANATAGFSIITYTGAGSAGTVGHGLGVAPKFLIVKNRSSATAYNWYVWHTGLTSASYFLQLNTTSNQINSNDPFNATAPTSTLFSVGGENIVNSVDYVAYAFSEVEGYSKFGSYSASGQTFVYTGFAPAFVMIKALESANWVIFDRKRSPYNKADEQLSPNSNAQEVTNDGDLDFLSNGFKLLSGAATTNAYNYVYVAFASSPFGGSGVSPATAR